MSTAIKRRRGTTIQHSTFTGQLAELTVDTDKKVLMVHDGVKAGGYPTDYVINAQRYGATGDGVTDDTTNLQAAVTAAAGKRLSIPAGTYLISSPINVPSNTIISGEAMGTVIKLSTGDISGFYLNATSGVTIKDIQIRCSVAGTTAYVGGIFLNGAANTLITNVSFIGLSWAGVYINNSSNNKVARCRFSGWLGTISDSADVMIYRDSNFNTVTDCICGGGGSFGVAIQDPYSASYPTGNIVTNNTVSAHLAYGIMVYVTTFYNTQTIISNNNVRDIVGSAVSGASGCGIYVQSAGGTVVSNNVVTNCCTGTTNFGTLAPAGIGITNILSSTKPVMVIGNTINAMTKGPGIFVTTSGNVVISNNAIDIQNSGASTNGYGIAFTNVTRSTIDGNNIVQRNSNYGAIAMIASAAVVDAITISNNIIYTTAGFGINFDVAGGGTFVRAIIAGNNVEASLIALALNQCTDFSITENIFISASSYPTTITNSPRTRITMTRFLANTGGKGPIFTGTCTGSFMEKSCYYTTFMENDAGSGFIVEQFGTAAPVGSGYWAVGDIVVQSVPVVGSPKQWRCTVAGNPGTWVSEGNL
jgi:hypothetical protein